MLKEFLEKVFDLGKDVSPNQVVLDANVGLAQPPKFSVN